MTKKKIIINLNIFKFYPPLPSGEDVAYSRQVRDGLYVKTI